MDWVKTLQKGLLSFVTGLTATVIFGIIQAVTNYQPVICSETVVDHCTPRLISTAYYAIIPTLVGVLSALHNWLKHKDDA